MNAHLPAQDLHAALHACEERYRSLFARSPVPMFVFDPASLAILAVNDAAVARYGYAREEFTRLTLRDIRPRQELGSLWRARAAMLAGQDVHGVYRHLTRDGEVFDVEVRTTALAEGDRTLMVSTATDVSEYRRAADVAVYLDRASSLLTSTLERRMICRSLATLAAARLGDWCAVHWLAGDGRVELCGFAHGNPLDEAIVGPMVRARDVSSASHPVMMVRSSGRTLVLGPGVHGPLVRGDAAVAATAWPASAWQLEARTAMYVPIRGSDGLIAVMECVAATDERAASAQDTALAEELAVRAGAALQNALQLEQARRDAVRRRTGEAPLLAELDATGDARRNPQLLQVLEHITDGFLMVDAEWRCTYLNQAAERMFALPREEILGRTFWSVFPNCEGTPFEREYGQAMRTRQPTEFEAYYSDHDAWYTVSVQPAPDGLGIFFRDTTSLHRAEEAQRASERQFFEYAELASELIHVVRADGSIVYANRAWQEALGYDRETLHSLRVSDVLAAESREPGMQTLARAASGELVRDVELTVVAADGRRIRVRGSGCGWAAPGEVPAVVGIMREVLDAAAAHSVVADTLHPSRVARRGQAELVERMNFELRTPLTAILGLADLLERTAADRLAPPDLDFVRRIGRQGRLLLRTVEDILTYAELDARGPARADAVQLPALLEAVAAEVRAREPGREVEVVIDPSPASLAIDGDRDRIAQLLRYLLEHALAAAGGRVRVSLGSDAASIAIPVLRVDLAGNAGGATLGLTIARSLAGALGFALRRVPNPDEGTTFELRFAAAPQREEDRGWGKAAADPELAALLHAVVNASPLAVVVYDTNLVVRLWSDAAVRMFGWPAGEIVGRELPIVPPEELPRLRELLREAVGTGVVTEASVRRRHRDGHLIQAHSSIAPLRDPDGRLAGYVTLIADVTERSRLEAQLRQAQKMEVVGQLAGGIAHDFNNLLTVIGASAWFLLEGLPPGDARRIDAEEIQAAAQRAAALTRQLLVFTRRTSPDRRTVDLREIVHGTERMLRRVIGSDIEVATITDDRPCLVRVDPGQLEQVLMNLAVNARDAMPAGGVITIEVHAGDRGPDRWVELAVADTGAGMTPEVRARAFEPFFTTKEAGHGTGLGLAIVHAIVNDAGGAIVIDTAPGEGTSVRIRLPAATGTVDADRSVATTVPARGSGTVLVVEDQDALRRLVARALHAAGYTVLTARHGADAIEVAATHDGPIDVLVTDMVMPVLDGATLATRLRALRPAIRVVVVSGYSERLARVPGDAVHVQKPFTTVELAAAVQQALATAT